MDVDQLPSPEIFQALRNGKVASMVLTAKESGSLAKLRPFLSYLVRCSPCYGHGAGSFLEEQHTVMSVLSGLEVVNSIVDCLCVDSNQLQGDIEKEKRLREKEMWSGGGSESFLSPSLQHSLTLEFERGDLTRKLRLLLREMLRMSSQVQSRNDEWFPLSCSLLDSSIYFFEVLDLLHWALTELHEVVLLEEVISVLLRVRQSKSYICHLLAGMPFCYETGLECVVRAACRHSDEQSQAWRTCTSTLVAVCSLDFPAALLRARQQCVELDGHPSLLLFLTREIATQQGVERAGDDIVDFLSSLLLSCGEKMRLSVCEYIRTAQRKGSRGQKSYVVFNDISVVLQERLFTVLTASEQPLARDAFSFGVLDSGSGEPVEMVMETGQATEQVEVMDIGMPLGTSSLSTSISTATSIDEEELTELPPLSMSPGTTNNENTAKTGALIHLNEGEDLLQQLNQSILSLDTPMPERASCSLVSGLDSTLRLNEDDVQLACRLLRCFCAMVGLGGLRLTGEQGEGLVQLITSHPPLTAAGGRFVELGLCTLIVCPSLTSDMERSRSVVEWLQWLLTAQDKFDESLRRHAPYGELLLLVAIHFHGNQLESVVELARSVLGMEVEIRPNSLTALKMLFTQDVFTEKVVINHAVRVGITENLSAGTPGYLPIHCLLQLFRARAFSRHSNQLKEWIYRQVRSCLPPVHPLLSDLVEEFVRSLIVPLPGVPLPPDGVQRGFTDDEILAPFRKAAPRSRGASSDTGESPTTNDGSTRHPVVGMTSSSNDCTVDQLLILFYVLTYHDMLLANLKKILGTPGVSRSANPVSLSPAPLLSQLPVKRLLVVARSSSQRFGRLYPALLRLLATHLPHLCLTLDWLSEEEEERGGAGEFGEKLLVPDRSVLIRFGGQVSQASSRHGSGLSGWLPCFGKRRRLHLPTPEQLAEAYRRLPTLSSLCCTYLQRISSVRHALDLLPYLDCLVAALPVLIQPGVARRAVTSSAGLWCRLSSVAPRRLWVETVNSLCTVYNSTGSLSPPMTNESRRYTEDDLTENPLIVLRCQPEVFRCPPVFDIVIRILTAYLAASRARLTEHAQTTLVLQRSALAAPGSAAVLEHESDELRSALIAAQDSAAVQMLMEVCQPNEESSLSSHQLHLSSLTEIRCLACSALHQMFIDDPNVAKLVHFQGYDERLLPLLVTGVPSMHICIDFVPELLSQPQLEKQVFAVQLASYLCNQYPLAKTLSVTRGCLTHLSRLLSSLPCQQHRAVFMPCLPAIVRACLALPPLLDDAVPFLLRLGQITTKSSDTASVSPPRSPLSSVNNLRDIMKQLPSADRNRDNLRSAVIDAFARLVEGVAVRAVHE